MVILRRFVSSPFMCDLLFDYVCDWLVYYDVLDVDMFIHHHHWVHSPGWALSPPPPPFF